MSASVTGPEVGPNDLLIGSLLELYGGKGKTLFWLWRRSASPAYLRVRFRPPRKDDTAQKSSPFPDLSLPHAAAPPHLHVRHNRVDHLTKLRHLYPIPGPIPDQVSETEHQVPVRDGSRIRVRIFTPTAEPPASSSRPLILAFHEGGWSMGDLSDEDTNCRLWTRDLGAVCVNVEYRLAPEHRFPTSVTDAYDAVAWCAATASPTSTILPADPRRGGFVVSGASAGGNLAAVVCQLARDAGLRPALTGQYLCVPALLWTDVVPERWRPEYRSRFESADDPVLRVSEDSSRNLREALGPDTASPLFSPLLHEDLTGLPPAFFQLGGLDPLRDEGLIYERVLREESGTPTRMVVYDGYGHMFWTNWPTMRRSREFWDDMVPGMRWLIEQSKQ